MENSTKKKQRRKSDWFYKPVKSKLFAGIIIGLMVLSTGCEPSIKVPPSVIWEPGNSSFIKETGAKVLGNPTIKKDNIGNALSFDGIADGLIIDKNPVEGWSKFTIEALFRPMEDGPKAPRFIHFQDTLGNRGTLEIRVTPQGRWYADTFLKNGKSDKGLTLIDSTHQHPSNHWYWLALVYDGQKMSHYVNGVKELEGEIEFNPMRTGKISIGVRLNEAHWFKGQIREIQFHPVALNHTKLQSIIRK
jgi:hypothetical protein